MLSTVGIPGAVSAWLLLGLVGASQAAEIEPRGVAQSAQERARIKERYVRFLAGTDKTFSGKWGVEACEEFLRRIRKPIRQAKAFDFSHDAGKPFSAFPGDPGHKEERAAYSPILQQYLLSLAYGYCVDAPGSPYYHQEDVLKRYIDCLDYLYGRGIRKGMTFHYNSQRMDMRGAPKPPPGCANLAEMELRMGALSQSVLLMEPYFHDTQAFENARELVAHLEMLGRTSGHVRYYEPYTNPPAFADRVQSDAIQNFSDTVLVSALLERDPARSRELLLEAQRVFSDSLKVIPGWADTIKPDFVGFHHRGIYGNAYTGGFIPQAAFGVHVLRDTAYAVEQQSVENLRQLILTYRLYCQKYAMPFGIRGRMPLNAGKLKTDVFTGILIYASSLGLDDAAMKPVFARLWDVDEVGLSFLFSGGRGKSLRGLYPLEMLRQLQAAGLEAESDPSGFWYKPYGGLALHRRDNWLVAVKGHSKYVWDYENGDDGENVYGQFLSHGMVTVFAQGDPVDDLSSGYRLNEGWDWYRLPGTTAIRFPLASQEALAHRQFSPETFLGGVSCDDKNGVWGMILNQPTFGDGSSIDLKARKSAFFMDDLIVLLGSGISGGDGAHSVETTLFQTFIDIPLQDRLERATCLVDSVGNGYYVPDTSQLRVFEGEQRSFHHNGRTPTEGKYRVAWLDHGVSPHGASYHYAIVVRGADSIERIAEDVQNHYRVSTQTDSLHHVEFPKQKMSGFVFFKPTETDHAVVSQATEPCLVMCRQVAGDRVQLGVVNPDIGLMEPDTPTPTFKYLRDNQYQASQPRTVDIVLRGAWRPADKRENVTVVSQSPGQTKVRFTTLHGMSIQTQFIRRERTIEP